MRSYLFGLFILAVFSATAHSATVVVQPENVDFNNESSQSYKSPLLAGTLSFLLPGIGQIYNGESLKGFINIGVFTTALAVGFIATGDMYDEAPRSTTQEVLGGVCLVAVFSSMIWSIWDAQATAKRINKSRNVHETSIAVAGYGPLGVSLNADRGELEARATFAFGF